jgi:hypothetical protein
MSLPPLYAIDPRPLPTAPRAEGVGRERDPSIRNAGLITGACVAGGFTLAMATLPPPQTPDRVRQHSAVIAG